MDLYSNVKLYLKVDETNSGIRRNHQSVLKLNSDWSIILYSSGVIIFLSLLGIFTVSSNMWQSMVKIMIAPMFLFWGIMVFRLQRGEIRRLFVGLFSIYPHLEYERKHYSPLVNTLKEGFDDAEIREELSIIESVIKQHKSRSRAVIVSVTATISVIASLTNTSAPKKVEDGIAMISGSSEIGAVLGALFLIFYGYALLLRINITDLNYYAGVFRHSLNWSTEK